MDKDQKPGELPDKEEQLQDEEIIDLTQVMKNEEDEDVIDLSEALDTPAAPGNPDEMDDAAIPLLDVVPTDESNGFDQNEEEKVIDLTNPASVAGSGAMLKPVSKAQDPSPGGEIPSETLQVNQQQLEDALVRVVEKIYGEKIEQLLVHTIEKTIKKEIDAMRQALLDDKL